MVSLLKINPSYTNLQYKISLNSHNINKISTLQKKRIKMKSNYFSFLLLLTIFALITFTSTTFV